MPAPARQKPYTHFPYAIEAPRGIVGVYTDKEIDALLQGAGIIPVDLSQYPTKAEVAATYATKAELAAAVLGGTADLSAYSTTVQIAAIYATKTELANHYTKTEVDAIVAGINAGTVDLSAYATTVVLTEAVQDLTAQIVARYTKDEVDDFLAAIPPGAITVHDEELPAIGTTPQAAAEALRPYAQGCHWFARSRGLMLLNRDPVLGGEQVVLTAITPGQCVEGKIVAYVPPNGTVNTPASVLTVAGGGRVTRMEAATLNDEFMLKGSGDVVTAVTQQQLAAAIAIVDAAANELALDIQAVNDQTAVTFQLFSDGLTPKFDAKADKTDVYTKTETNAAIANAATGGTVDLSGYAPKSTVYTKDESDAKYVPQADYTSETIVAALAGRDLSIANLTLDTSSITFGDGSAIASSNGRLFYAADANDPGRLEEVVFKSDAVAPPPAAVDLSKYAKLSDTEQAIVAKTVTAEAVKAPYLFFDEARGLTILDTNEGYGERLYLANGLTLDGVVLKSDLDPLFPRVEALESRSATVTAAAAGDLSGYYTAKQVDDRFVSLTDGMTKTDLDNAMVTMLYSRKQVDEKLAAVAPMGATSINDPAFADLRTSILNEVKRMLAGGAKYPPPDLDWTICRNAAGNGDSGGIYARMIGGMIEFRGTLLITKSSGSQSICQLPASFPLPDMTASYPIAARLVGVNAVYAYATVGSTSRTIGITPGGTIDEITFSGLRFRAAY